MWCFSTLFYEKYFFMKNIDLLKFVVYFCFMWRCTGHVTMTVVVYFNSSTGPTINPNKTLGSQFFKGQLVIQFLFIFTLFMANNFSHTIWKSVNWSKTHEQAEQTKASASKHLFILITHLCESRDLINIEHAYSRHSLPQAGFDPPAQSDTSYEADALPPSHHGWMSLSII